MKNVFVEYTYVKCIIHCRGFPVYLHIYTGEHHRVMGCFIFWDITPCSPLKVNRHLTFHLLSHWFLA
jgi:hypothetical protein